MSSVALSYLVAVHNEEAGLPGLVARLRERLASLPGSEIVLCENGSRDGSLAVAQKLAAAELVVPVRVLTTAQAGLGCGLAMGMQDVLDRASTLGDDRWIVLTAADLPFGFTDLEELLAWRERHTEEAILVGSKAHPQTIQQRDWKRSVASFGFHSLRSVVLGMKTHDPQGTFFIPVSAAKRLLPKAEARNYFFTTELVYFAEKLGIPVVEVPVVFAAERRKSTVRIWKHGRQMAGQTLALRWRDLRPR